MLVELPFASFFLCKLLSLTNTDVDINHLESLDPEMYRCALNLKKNVCVVCKYRQAKALIRTAIYNKVCEFQVGFQSFKQVQLEHEPEIYVTLVIH